MSTTTITGNIGADGTLKYTPSGSPVLEVSIADTPRRKTEQGWEDAGPTAWYRASIWGPFAEAIANAGIAVKGARIEVTGVLTVRPYEVNGEHRTSLDVRVSTVGFPESRTSSPRQQQAQAPRSSNEDPWATGAGRNDEPPF